MRHLESEVIKLATLETPVLRKTVDSLEVSKEALIGYTTPVSPVPVLVTSTVLLMTLCLKVVLK